MICLYSANVEDPCYKHNRTEKKSGEFSGLLDCTKHSDSIEVIDIANSDEVMDIADSVEVIDIADSDEEEEIQIIDQDLMAVYKNNINCLEKMKTSSPEEQESILKSMGILVVR